MLTLNERVLNVPFPANRQAQGEQLTGTGQRVIPHHALYIHWGELAGAVDCCLETRWTLTSEWRAIALCIAHLSLVYSSLLFFVMNIFVIKCFILVQLVNDYLNTWLLPFGSPLHLTRSKGNKWAASWAIQPKPHPWSSCSPISWCIYPAVRWTLCPGNLVRHSIKSFTKIQKDYISWPSLITWVGYPVIKGNQIDKQHSPLMKPCWVWPMTSLSFKCFSTPSRIILSITLPSTEVRLTGHSRICKQSINSL